MYGIIGTWGAAPETPASDDPMQNPLKPEKPPTWEGRLERVRWVIENFTPGELAMTYKIAHDANRIKISRDQCDQIIRKEIKELTNG